MRTLGGNSDNSSTFSGAIAMNGNLTVSQVATTSGNKLNVTGAFSTNGNALTFTGAGDVNLTVALSTSGNLTKTGAGTLTTDDIASDGLFTVSGGSALIGDLSGTGDTVVNSGLTAKSVVQDTLTIGAGGNVTIRATPVLAGGAAMGPATEAVPEPATWAMILAGAVAMGLYWRRKRKPSTWSR